ncbi:MAG: hypothetical protein JSR48_02905 [Verrucomicrobia bacterium]|nr:hypothetical protein [Verrucomicrobiota bacterium]
MTDTPAAGTNRFDRLLGRAAWLAGQAALVLLLWLTVVKFPSSPASDLDPSWRMVLGYAEAHNFQFGTDLIFTYGPLGYLLPSTSIGIHYWHHIVWQIAAHGILALSLYLLARQLPGWRRGLFYAYLLAFGLGYMDVVHMVAILLYGFALLHEPVVRRRWLTVLLTLFLAVLTLVKFTNLLLAGFAVACAVAHYAWRRRWPETVLIAGTFAAGVLGGWVACGQHLGNLPAYVLNSLEVSRGYGEAMSVDGSNRIIALGLGALAALVAYYLLVLARATDRPRAVAGLAIAAAASYLNWKHGFVRADGHVLAHFFLCLFLALAGPLLLGDNGALRRTKGVLLLLTAACSVAGIWVASAVTLTDAGAALNYRVKENLAKVADLPRLSQFARDEFAAVSNIHQLAAAKALVRDQTVDILGSEQAYAIFNGLNYRPRPVFQSYFPYTARLERLNEAFMRSDRAPEFILQKIQTIDYRLPSLDDSLVTRYLYHHYTYILEDRDFLLWKRNPPNPALDTKTLLSSTEVKFGEQVKSPILGDTPVWCELEIRPSLLGRIRDLLYKPPQLKLAVSDGTDQQSTYRLVGNMARAGFLLYPHFTNTYNVRAFQGGGTGPRIFWFAVELDPAMRKFFAPTIGVKIYRLPPFERSRGQENSRPEIRYRTFSQPPVNVSAPYPTDILIEDNREVLLAHPPSKIEFDLDRHARHITGKFGLVKNAYSNGNTTDGVVFTIEWVNSRGEVSTEFERYLRPLTIPKDRGAQSFDLTLPESGGHLIFRTGPGPANDIAFDWAYWSEVKFSP